MSIIRPITLTISEILHRIGTAVTAASASQVELKKAYEGTDPNLVFQNGTFRSTAIALGSNPAVSAKPLLASPTITSAEITTDGINNPYVIVNFEISQQSVDANNIIAFKLYRQEVPAEDLAQEVEAFTKADFDKLARQSTMTGKFAADRKAAYTIDAFKQPQVVQNTNLNTLQQTANSQQLGTTNNNFPDYFSEPLPKVAGEPELLATINYKDAQAAAKAKQVFVQTKNEVTLSYNDYKVVYGAGYVYTMTSLCASSDESNPSETLSLVVLNLNGIGAPTGVVLKQVSDTVANISVSVAPGDLVKYVYLYRRDAEDLVFHPFAILNNANNQVTFVDTDLEYLHTYVYRVLLESVFGAVSEPVEVQLTCTVQNIIQKTRSNNLKLPIIIASQDQNSNGIKVSIFPNDNRVLYYELERRNITAGETKFSAPANKYQQFWPLNQFFVQPVTGSLLTSGTVAQISSGSLPAQSQFIDFADPIEFIDNIVAPGDYYQYRTAGYDLFGNVTGYGFASISARNKNILRTPINFVAETLRESPFRIKLTWQDDNAAAAANTYNAAQQKYLQVALSQVNLSQQQQQYIETMLEDQDLNKIDLDAVLAPYNIQKEKLSAIQSELTALNNVSNPLKFQLQRRLTSDAVYSSFPYTENNWVVDEVATSDFVPFSPTLITGSAVPGAISSSVMPGASASLSRSFGLPDYLQAQQIYQYRVNAMTLDGATSDFSAPITVIASAQISNPVNFSASILNPNVLPCVVRLEWALDLLKNRPDHWRIERRVNVATEDYRVIGNSYLNNVYFDRTAQTGLQYIYRIRSISAVGDESDTIETSIST